MLSRDYSRLVLGNENQSEFCERPWLPGPWNKGKLKKKQKLRVEAFIG